MIDLSKPWPFGLSMRNWMLFAGGFVGLLCLLSLADHALSVVATSQRPDVVAFFNEVTRWGESDWILIPSVVLLVVSAIVARLVPQRISKLALIEMIEMYALIFVGVGLPGLAANLLKRVVGRSRPELFDTVGTLSLHPFANSYVYEGFPSGHTTTAFAAAMVLGFLAPRWFGLGLVYAGAVAVSRLVGGAHYPTDVLGGMVLGTLGAYGVRNAFARRRWGFECRPDGGIVQRRPVATLRLVRSFQRKAAR